MNANQSDQNFSGLKFFIFGPKLYRIDFFFTVPAPNLNFKLYRYRRKRSLIMLLRSCHHQSSGFSLFILDTTIRDSITFQYVEYPKNGPDWSFTTPIRDLQVRNPHFTIHFVCLLIFMQLVSRGEPFFFNFCLFTKLPKGNNISATRNILQSKTYNTEIQLWRH